MERIGHLTLAEAELADVMNEVGLMKLLDSLEFLPKLARRMKDNTRSSSFSLLTL